MTLLRRASSTRILGTNEPRGEALFGGAGEEYRYALSWSWAPSPRRVAAFIMLNPSTATEVALDPTLTRCAGFARAWGYGGMVIGNAFALRSTDPDVLLAHEAPVGPENDDVLEETASRADLVVVAWGNHAALTLHARPARVMDLLTRLGKRPMALALNKDGSPRHPLYVRGDTQPVPWSEPT